MSTDHLNVDISSATTRNSLVARADSHVPITYFQLPKQWLSSYASFVKENASQVSYIESALRSLTYIIPGRFHDTPLTSELLHTFLSLLTAYHTHLLPSPLPPSPTARYQRFWQLRSPTYISSATLLRTIQYTQLLCELFAKRASEKVRWRVIVILEMVKAVLRLVMGRASGRRAVVGTSVGDERQERRAGDDVVASPEADWNTVGNTPAETDWKMPRTGMQLPQIPSNLSTGRESIIDFLGKRVIKPDEIKSAKDLVRTITHIQGQIAEMLWILRPLAYALALQRCQTNRRDWRPWALGLAIELTSRYLAQRDVQQNIVGGFRGLSSVEKDEAKRRGWGMAWWAMRGAFYEHITRTWLQKFAGSLKGKPLLDMVGVVVEDYGYLWGEYYFATATL